MVASHAFLSTMVVVKLAKLLQQRWLPTSSLLQQWWLPKSMVVATICCTCNGNKPNNTCLSKKLVSQGIDPRTHKPLKPNPDSSEIANVPVQNSNPKSSPVDENGRVYRTLATRVSENFTVTTNLDQSPNQAAADATENWPNRDGFNMGSLQSGYGRKNEDDFIEDIGNEDTFSSFLDSLLNENVFVYQQRQQLQQQNMLGPSSKLAVSSSQLLSHANVWEAEVSPPMAALGDKGVGGASNRLPV